MLDVEIIAQALDYIEDHLRDPIGVGDISHAMHYSLYYFSRSFQQATHHTVYDYLIRRRIAEACDDLVTTRRNIVDIAFEYQFNSHETFTRAFRRIVGISPSEWRLTADQYFAPMPRLTLQHLKTIPALHEAITERKQPEIWLSGISGLLLNGTNPAIYRDWFAKRYPVGEKGRYYEVIQYEAQRPVAMFIGVAGDTPEAQPALLARTKLSAGHYICCPSKDKLHTHDQLLIDYLLYTHLPNGEYSPSRTEILYHRDSPERMLICIPVMHDPNST